MIKQLIGKIIGFLFRLLSFIPAIVYTHIYSNFYTLSHLYQAHLPKKLKKVLDVGTATGEPLHSIIDSIDSSVRVLGIDISNHYLQSCRNLFASHKNVEIRQMNFYSLSTIKEKFSAIIFGSSFMLMPDQIKALQVAKDNLQPNGTIYFLQTIYVRKEIKQLIISFIKPYLFYLTTVDFGKITYRDDFQKLLQENGLKIRSVVRTEGNMLLKVFGFYMIQATHE